MCMIMKKTIHAHHTCICHASWRVVQFWISYKSKAINLVKKPDGPIAFSLSPEISTIIRVSTCTYDAVSYFPCHSLYTEHTMRWDGLTASLPASLLLPPLWSSSLTLSIRDSPLGDTTAALSRGRSASFQPVATPLILLLLPLLEMRALLICNNKICTKGRGRHLPKVYWVSSQIPVWKACVLLSVMLKLSRLLFKFRSGMHGLNEG